MKELGSIGKNTAWQIFGKGLGTAISMVSVFFIIRLLGPANYGTFALLTTIMNLFYMLSGLGFEQSMPYFLSKYKNSQLDLIKKFLKARGVLIILASLVLFLSVNFIADYYGNAELKSYLPWIALSMPVFIIMNNAPHILQGLNNLKTTSIADLIFNIAKIAAIPLIIYFSIYGGIMGYFIAYAAYSVYAYKKISELSKSKNKKFDKYGDFAKFSLVNYAGTIIVFLYLYLLPLILGKFPVELGYLDASGRVGTILTLFSTALFTALIPGIVGKKVEEIRNVSSKIINYVLIYLVPLLAFFLFASNFATEFLLGSEFSSIYMIIQIVSVANFFNIFCGFFESISYSVGKNKYNVIGYLLRLIIVVIFSAYAINAFNVSLIFLGAAFANFIFISIKSRKYYSIDLRAAGKILAFCLPLILFFAIDMNIILKIAGSAVSSAVYLFLIWKKVLDNEDRGLFRKFYLKLKGIIFKN